MQGCTMTKLISDNHILNWEYLCGDHSLILCYAWIFSIVSSHTEKLINYTKYVAKEVLVLKTQ